MDEMDRQYVAVDDLEIHLGSEYENGRLFRLSLKLSQLLDTPSVSTSVAMIFWTSVGWWTISAALT
jgi:hypothetical protein